MAFSHGLCLGSRQLTILTPWPLFLTSRLCLPSQRLTSRLMCQLALSQMRSRTFFLPPASSFELLAAPSEKPNRYPTHGPTIHEPQPRLIELWHIEPVAADGLRIGIIFSDRPLDKAHRLPLLGPATQGRQSQPAPP